VNPQPPQIPDAGAEGRGAIPPALPPDQTQFVKPFNDGRLIEYYYQLFDWHGYIRFLGLPHLRENPDVPLWELFVPPSFAAVHISPDLPLQRWPPTQGVVDTLIAAQRLVLLGDPGSGKSTLVNWIAWQFSRVAEGHLTTALGRLIPFPLILRDLRIDRNITWERLLEEFLRRPLAKPFEGNAALLTPYLESGQALILLDGLDEVGDVEVRRRLREAVWEGFRRFPRCRWVLTSRLVAYDLVPFDHDEKLVAAHSPFFRKAEDEGPPLRVLIHPAVAEDLARARYATFCHLAPFSDAQIEQFVHNWYSLREAAKEEAQAEARKLVQAIRANPGTERLARIPNLLTLITLIYRIRRELPHGRVMLYDRIAEAYLESIDTYRGLRELDYPLAQKKRWLQYVGFQMQRQRSPEEEQRAILVDQKTVEGWLLEAMKASRPAATPQEAATYLNFVGRRSGLLLPRGEGQYAFMHLSFQEYFAAGYLAEQILSPRWLDGKAGALGARQEDLHGYLVQVQWRETLILLFEMLAERTGWGDELADCLFGMEFHGLSKDSPEGRFFPAVTLLAALSADPYSGLSLEKRQAAWGVCWRFELQRQQEDSPFFAEQPVIAQLLLSASEGLLTEVTKTLVNQALGMSLRVLNLRGCVGMSDLSPLRGLTALRELNLSGCAGLTDLSPLQGLTALRELNLSGCVGVSDLSPLRGLTALYSLTLRGCVGVSDLSPLQGLTTLQWLDLIDCVGVSDLSPLRGLTALHTLDLSDCTRVTDLSPVAHVRDLFRR
jgi:internalin A